jgi:hypothetical protein
MMKKYELKFTDKEGRTMSRIILGLLNLIDVIEREGNEIEKYSYKVEFFETAIDETDTTH